MQKLQTVAASKVSASAVLVSFNLYSCYLTRPCSKKVKTLSIKTLFFSRWLVDWLIGTRSQLLSFGTSIFSTCAPQPEAWVSLWDCEKYRFLWFLWDKSALRQRACALRDRSCKMSQKKVRSSTCNVHKSSKFITYGVRQINPSVLLHFYSHI